MISFTPLNEAGEGKICSRLAAMLPEADSSEIYDIISSFDSDEDVAFSASHGCILIRIFDGEYLFVYPVAMSESSDELAALNDIRLYAVKEEIPLTVVDTPAESLSGLRSLFKYTEIYAEDADASSYTVRVRSELMLSETLPVAVSGELSLTAPTDADKEVYYRICTDKKLNEYWGYDYTADFPDADSDYFMENAAAEAERGTSLSLAVRLTGEMIGEAILYAFDFQGGAECAIRLLPEQSGKGYGKAVLPLLLAVASEIGLNRLYATVQNANIPSLSLFGKEMSVFDKNEKITRFYTNL